MSNIIRRKSQGVVERVARPTPMIEDIYDILSTEIRKLNVKSRGTGLNPQDLKLLSELSQTLIKLNKEDRERHKHAALLGELENMSQEELLEIVKAEMESDDDK